MTEQGRSNNGSLADRVAPVPPEIIPPTVKKTNGSTALFKEEFRAAQRLRNNQGIFIPEVIRVTHPPEFGPHGIASNPAPTYAPPSYVQRPKSRKLMGPGHFDRPMTAKSNASATGPLFHFSETRLNTPGTDYALRSSRSAQLTTAMINPKRPMSVSPQRPRPMSAIEDPLRQRMAVRQSQELKNRPATALPTTRSLGLSRPPPPVPAEITDPAIRGSPERTACASDLGTLRTRPRHAPPESPTTNRLPRIPSAGRFDPGFSPIETDKSTMDFIRDVPDSDGLRMDPLSRPVSAMPPKHSPPSTWNAPIRSGFVNTMNPSLAQGTVKHLRAASASLRQYNVPPPTSALHPASTTFARSPPPPQRHDPLFLSPVERIAAYYSNGARGLSPRTLEILCPGGIRPGAMGALPLHRWAEVDDEDAITGVPEADGIMAAARKHMSFMPLEIFDNLEYETRTPEEWIKLGEEDQGTPGETLMYVLAQDTYVWAPCRVVGWDEEKRTFEVVLDQDKRKQVKRLNLRFDVENADHFERRVAYSKSARERAEEELRYLFYLDSLDVQEVIRTYDFNLALERAVAEVKGLSSSVRKKVGTALVEDLCSFYDRAVRRAVLEYRRLDPCEENRLRVLRLPPPVQKPPAPFKGVKSVVTDGKSPMIEYGSLVTWAGKTLRLAVVEVIIYLTQIESTAHDVARQLTWLLSPLTTPFAENLVGASHFGSIEVGRPPYAVDRFEALQHSHVKQVVRFIDSQLQIALNYNDDPKLNAVILPFKPDDYEGRHSFGKSVMLQLASKRFAEAVRDMMLDSAEAYAAAMEKYAVPSIPHDFSFPDVNRKGPTIIPEVFANGALMRISLVYNTSNHTLNVHPTPERIREVAAELFDDMMNDCCAIVDVFEDYRLGFDGKGGPPLLLQDFVWTEDPRLTARRKRVSVVVEEAMSAAHEVMSVFHDAAAGLAVDIKAILEALSPMNTPLSTYNTWLTRFKAAAQSATQAAPNELFIGLFVVDISTAKQSLIKTADSYCEALLNQLLNKTLETSRHVVERCEVICRESIRVCKDLTGVMDLKGQLRDYEEEVVALTESLYTVMEREEFRFIYRHPTPDVDTFVMVRAQAGPRQAELVIERAWTKVHLEHKNFLDSLKLLRTQLAENLNQMSYQVEHYKQLTDATEAPEHADTGLRLTARIATLAETAASINRDETLVSWELSEWPLLREVSHELEPYVSLWTVSNEWTSRSETWTHGPFLEMDSEEVEEKVSEWYNKMARLAKNLVRPEHRTLAESNRQALEVFRTYVPIVRGLINPGMHRRHWKQLSEQVGTPLEPTEELTLSRLIKAGIMDHLERVQDISDTAMREHALERQLDKMQSEWAGIRFELIPWKNTGGFILKGNVVEEVQMLLDDHTIKSQAMSTSPAAAPFAERIGTWCGQLQVIQNTLDAWLVCQQKWMYLGPVYSSEELARQMPKERNEFLGADTKWRAVMEGVRRNPEVIAVTQTDGIFESLTACNRAFATIEKSLNTYLDTKKVFFPRFFFLSNEELIEILSETRDPLNVQPFVKKIFEAVESFTFDEELKITALNSIEGEVIPLDQPVEAGGEGNGVERWLLRTETQMRKSLQHITATALMNYPKTARNKWVLEWPGQVVIAVGQVFWTTACESAILSGSLKVLEVTNTNELLQEVQLVRGELTKLQRATLGALVVVDVHARDVVSEMVKEVVKSLDDFGWQSRLRYAWTNDTLNVSMLNATCVYGYEYLGNSSRLVITPLTDRCYRTLLGAHHMNLGGAPAGPAGTGKTETTKDLAKAVAIQCVVFNCSDGLDYIAMGKFFKGLVASGAWACFDEFNRIELEVLSVVAQQVLTIQRAKAAGKLHFQFEGSDLPLIHTCNVFITMNPGYAGRSELPDNLKALFRDVAMMVPDYAMISEIILYSYGYMDARSLANKLVQTYRLCSEQLSSQDHYDYGMRAVMAVLRAAGNLKRRMPDEKEEVLMLRAITDVNLPKFLDEDVPLFRGILSDLFPGVTLPQADYTVISAAIAAAATRAGLQPLPTFIEKALQLYEMVVVRHGLMLVGSSFGMKTSAIRVLATALGDMSAAGQGEFTTKTWAINPKAITLGQLFGQDDAVSKEWTDGVLALAFRNAARDTSPDRKWIVLDGPVDAIWIENMNTVLDDNKKLCLNSGEIIAMQGLMNLIFEVADLAVASPATVSRCGMVYMQPSLLGWLPCVTSWLATLPETVTDSMKTQMLALFSWLVPPCLRLVTSDCKTAIPVQEINLVVSLTRLYTALLNQIVTPVKPSQPTVVRDPASALQASFLFSLIWSVGGVVDVDGRAKFSNMLHKFMAGEYPGDYAKFKGGPPVSLIRVPPVTAALHDITYIMARDLWEPWLEETNVQRISPDAEFGSIIVTTPDVVRYTFLLNAIVGLHLPIIMVGPTGTGKTVYIKSYLAQLGRNAWQTAVFSFSAQTSVNLTQDMVDGKLDKRRRGVYGPPVGKRMVLFVDDLNMPQVEQYGAQPPIELLRQVLDHNGWYDRSDLSFRTLVDVSWVAAMGPPGGGRQPVTQRYTRHYNIISVTEFDNGSMTRIFGRLVEWWFTRCKYGEELCILKGALVAASLELYGAILKALLPTPAKTHYIFNLRDLSNMFGGMAYAGTSVTGPEMLTRVWAHEMLRVFHDRLVDDEDRQVMKDLLVENLENHFRVKISMVLTRPPPDDPDATPIQAELDDLLFANFMYPGQLPRQYTEVVVLDRMNQVVKEYLSDFNDTSRKPMDLVMFRYALHHIARISRVISRPGGAALLVGVGGSGRQSLTRLAAFIQEYNVHQVEITGSYSMSDWHDDLKAVLRASGEKAHHAVFLLSDSQIQNETYVEEISSLLSTGEIPNLFDAGEIGSICENVQSRARQAKMDGGRQELYEFFVHQVRHYLHIVLCFSPVGDAFRERLRRFPSLVTATTIDWFTIWPNNALESVAVQSLSQLEGIEDKLREALAAQCCTMHRTVRLLSEKYLKEAGRSFYVTPTSYLQLLDGFKVLLGRKQNEVSIVQRRYEIGLEKLATTEVSVVAMQAELEALVPKLEVSTREAEELLAVITQRRKEADEVKLVVQSEEAKAQAEAAKVQTIASECEKDLASAMPAYESAILALNTLTKNDISEVKGMKSPPNPVKLVMEAVCVLKGLRPTKVKDVNTGRFVMDYWETSKKMLSDMAFLESLKNYDKDNIPPEIVEQLQPLLRHPDCQPTKIKKVSQAAFGLVSWVRAMDTYDKVAKVVRPKKAALAAAQEQLEIVMTELRAKQDELSEVESRLAVLGTQLEEASSRRAALEAEVAICQEKLDRAQKLIGGLGGEKERWTQAAADLAKTYTRLTGDMLLSSAVIAYLGAFSGDYRAEAVAGWEADVSKLGIPVTPEFSLTSALGDPVQIRSWAICGLPKDDLSVTNGIIIFESKRWPLCIDPQGQANKWIRGMESDRHLFVLKPGEPGYLRSLAAALPLGRPVLLEGMGETLDASLEPVMMRSTFMSGGMQCIKLGDSIVEWHREFRLYLTTKLRNPHYPPEVVTRVSLLNFSITPEGLTEQLLGLTVARERPDLEEEKNKLIIQGAENQRKLKEVESEILRVLSSSQGNILDDGEAVNILQSAKKLSDEVLTRQREAEKTEAATDKARVAYKPVAAHASTLFFCVAGLSQIDPMYQYSLAYFTSLFLRSIEDSPKSSNLPKRLALLQEHFTYFLFTNICRSLFEKDKLLFAFSLAVHLDLANGQLQSHKLRFLLTGTTSMDNPHPNPAPDWLTSLNWANLCGLDQMGGPFAGLRTSLTSNAPDWQKFAESSTPYEEALPAVWGKEVDSFCMLLLVRCLAPDKLVPGLRWYVMQCLGERYVEPQEFKLGAIFADSSRSMPLIFVLSFGSDPMADLLRFADQSKRMVETISLGQGQGPIAEKMVEKAAVEGFWVVLQNCHLAASFLPRLEVLVETSLVGPHVHPDFRLWLTSYPSEIFPSSILENGLKITTEPPQGLRAGLERVYKSDPITTQQFFEGALQPEIFKNLLLGLAFFHCVVLGRRQYGSVGWNIPYTFNDNDLRISLRQLRAFLDQYNPVPLPLLVYTAGECNYGGKVTDAQDRRTLVTLLSGFYNEGVMLGGLPLAPGQPYIMPQPGPLPAYISWMSNLPLRDGPEVFGLHPNASITRDLQETKRVLDSCAAALVGCLAGTGKGGDGGASSGGSSVQALASEILEKIPEDFNIEKASSDFPISYLESMNTVLVQELGRANTLLRVIRSSLVSLLAALKGTLLMSKALEGLSSSLSSGSVPAMWLTRSFPSTKPLGPYVREVVERVAFFTKWLKGGPPIVYWVSAFFFTQAFLTGAKQNYARKYSIPIDLIEFDFSVKDRSGDCRERPLDGVLVDGLFLEAARWDSERHVLDESRPKELFVPVPPLLFLPMRSADIPGAVTYSCPLYKTSERRGVLSTTGHSTNFVIEVRLPTDYDPAHWVRRGVAMLTSLDS